MYPPREPNVRPHAEQFPGEYGYDRSSSAAISFRNSRKQYETTMPQDIKDSAHGSSVRTTGTLKTQPLNQSDDTDSSP
jgi:hypothetical protein